MNLRDWIQFCKGVGLGALIVTLAVLASIFLTAPAKAADAKLLYIDDEINEQSIVPIEKELRAQLESPSKPDTIDMLIDSPGGSVMAGMRVMNLMNQLQAQKVKFNCYVTNMAASMAFQIFTQCDKRIAMPGSFLLWHGIRIQTSQPITEELAQTIANDMRRLNSLILYQLRGALSLTDKSILKHFRNETLWTGYTLQKSDPGFLKLERGYPWLTTRLKTAVKTAPPQQFIFSFGNQIEYIYKWRNFKRKK